MGWESGIKEDRRELDTDADMCLPLVAKVSILMSSERCREKRYKLSDSRLISQTTKLL